MSIVTFPSGLVADLTKVKGGTIAALAAAADGAGRQDTFTEFLSASWAGTVERGPYTFVEPGDAKPDFKRLLKGDLYFGLMALRRLTLKDGNEYEFDCKCEQCNSKISWRLQLSDLAIKRLPKESFDRMLRGEAFMTSVEDEAGVTREVRFRLQTTAQEEEVHKLMRQQKRKRATLVDVLAGQTTHIDGLKSQTIVDRWKFFSGLGLGEMFELRTKMEEPDCGVDTAIEVVCQKLECNWEQTVNLPLDRNLMTAPRRKAQTRSPDSEGSEGTSQGSPWSGGEASSAISSGARTEEEASPG